MSKKIIHELNNILTSIGLCAEFLVKEGYGPINKQQKKYLKTIISQVKKIPALVKKLEPPKH